VQQSGVLAEVKMIQYFEKPLSKRERRRKAIVRRARKADKMTALKMGKKQ
jgi:ribosomal protein S21